MIYFIQQGEHGPVKIGSTTNVLNRLMVLQIGNPDKLYLRASIKGCVATERELHKRFARLRLSGEWFKAVDELRDFLDELHASNSPTRETGAGHTRQCRMCGLRYDAGRGGSDVATHRKRHNKIRNTDLPNGLVEYLKDWGRYIAVHGKLGSFSGGVYNKEIGKRINAFACWVDSNERLENPQGFERYMADRLDEMDGVEK